METPSVASVGLVAAPAAIAGRGMAQHHKRKNRDDDETEHGRKGSFQKASVTGNGTDEASARDGEGHLDCYG